MNFYVHEFGGTVNVLFSQLCRMFHVMERTEHTQQKNYTFLRISFNRSFRVESNKPENRDIDGLKESDQQ